MMDDIVKLKAMDEDAEVMRGWKERIGNLRDKLVEVRKLRDILDEEQYAATIAGIENALVVNKTVHLGQCQCAKPRSAGEETDNFFSGYRTCYTCLNKYRSGNKLKKSDNYDQLGWGISGTWEESNSDECSDNTSTDEDDGGIQRRLSYTKHKILRKLRRSRPELFELNYLDMSKAELLKSEIDDPEIRRKYLQVNEGNFGKQREKKNKTPQTPLTPTKENNAYGGGLFDFSNEITLKEKYSSTTFDFLTGVIHYYQNYLKQHSLERYPSVSQLMLKSGYNVCRDEDDIVDHYYQVIKKKGGRKKGDLPKKVGKQNEISKDLNHPPSLKSGDRSKGIKKNNEVQVSEEELSRARRTGLLDLSNRGLTTVSPKVWTLDRMAVENRVTTAERHSNPSPPKRTRMYKSLISLNLNNNKLTKFIPQGNSLSTLVTLCLNNNNIAELPIEFGNFKNLKYLDLENNFLEALPKSFCNLTSLKELNLQRNCLRTLPKNLGCLKKLVTLDLRWNELSRLPDTADDLESLKNLNLSFNKLRSLPIDLCNLYNLVILDVSYNNLAELPMFTDMPKLILVNAMGNLIKEFPNFSNCNSLCEIRLDANRIKRIVTKNLQDTPVVQLTLSYNKILYIPRDLYLIETLVLLDFTNNRLSQIPYTLARLKYLTCIKVDENRIENVSKDILDAGSKKILENLLHNLLLYEGDDYTTKRAKEDLEVLYTKEENTSTPVNKKLIVDPKEVAKTHTFIRKRLQLTDLPDGWIKIAKDSKVSIVDISKNKFRYIPAGLKLLIPWLKELIIRENQLKTIPDFIGRMQYLVILDLSFNHLDTLPLSMRACNLSKLICRRNMFPSIPKVVYLIITIEHLDFSENMIKEIDADGLRNLRKLNHLNLSKNEIRIVPGSLGYLMNIKFLDISDNLFKRPGPNVLRSGTQAILNYLKRNG